MSERASFEGGTAVVTGAASGIGAALAAGLAEEGCNVVLADRDVDGLEAVRERVIGVGVDAIAVRTDVSVLDDVTSLRDAALRRSGSVTVLCNNAGVMGPAGDPLWELPRAEWERVVAVNVWGVLHGVQAFLPPMLAAGSPAHVMNTASMQGFTTGPFIPEYTLSKHAVVALSESLDAQLRTRGAPIRVHVLCPSAVATELASRETERLGTHDAPWAISATATGVVTTGIHMLSPEEVATAAIGGMRAGDFYIFTHPGSHERIQPRVAAILSASAVPDEPVGG